MFCPRFRSTLHLILRYRAGCTRAYSTARPAVRKRTITDSLPKGMPSITSQFHGPDADIQPYLDAWRPSDAHEYRPWYSVLREFDDNYDNLAVESRELEFRERATPLWEALKAECRRIKREAPTRSNKKLGTKSQKQLRQEAHATFNPDIEVTSKDTGYIGGRWFCSLNPAKVDDAWAAVAKAVGTRGGALFDSTCAHAQISARPSAPMGHFESTWSLILMCQNSYDREAVGHVARTLVKLGIQPGYFKTDAFSALRILSKNEAQIEPVLYKGRDFVAPDATGPTWTRRNARVAVAGGFV